MSLWTVASHLLAFALGGALSLCSLVLCIVLFVYWLPYYLTPEKSDLALPQPRPPIFSSTNSSKDVNIRPNDLRDVQLGKIGWIRMATRPLTPEELADFGPHSSSSRDVPAAPPAAEASSDLPAHAGNNTGGGSSPPPPLAQPASTAPNTTTPTLRGRVLSATVSAAFSTASIATTLASRFIPQSLGVVQRFGLSTPADTPTEPTSPPASPADTPSEPLPKPYRDVCGVLKQKTLLLYESDDERECTDVLLLPQYRVDLYPENLPDNEIYARENPVRIRSKALLDLQRGRRKRNGSSGPSSGDVSVAEGSAGLEFSTQRMLTMYVYAPTGCDKEDWYLMLRRSSRLRTRHGSGAGTDTGSNSSGSGMTGRVESIAMKNYRRIMQKLVERVKGVGEAEGESGEKKPGATSSPVSGSPQSMSGESFMATAWLNALVGRAFVAIHSNLRIKEWLLAKLSRRTKHAVPVVSSFKDGVSSAKSWFSRIGSTVNLDPKQQQQQHQQQFGFLGDIVIQDIDVGDSIPVLSNPKLLDLSVDGDMRIEMDIEYTGGARVQAATLATISVPSLDRYGVKPLQVPLVVAIRVKRFAARVLLKIKPYWETNRVWVGFYRDPGIQLELDVEPIISNKLIKLHLVNQVIERRVIDALEEFVMLPNMDDWSFWPLPEGKGGIFWGDDPVEDDEDDTDDAITDGEDGGRLDDVNGWLRRNMGRIREETRSEIDELADERARINGLVNGMYHTPPRTAISSTVTGTIVPSSRSRSTTAETQREELVNGGSRSRYEYDMGETVVDLTKVGEFSRRSGSWTKGGEDGDDGDLTPVVRRRRPRGFSEPGAPPAATVNEAVKKLIRPTSDVMDSERARSVEEWVRDRIVDTGDAEPADDEDSDVGSVYYRDDGDNDEGVEADDEGGEEREGEQSPVTPGELNVGGSSSAPATEPASESTTATASPAHTWSSRALQILSSPRTRDATSTVARTAGYLAARAMTSTVSLLEVAGVVVPINDEQVQMNNSLFTKQREPSGISVVSSTSAAPSAAGEGAQRDDIATAAAAAAAAAANELLDFAIERVGGGGFGEGSRSAPSTPEPTLSAAAAHTPNRSLPQRASFPRLRSDRPVNMYNNFPTPGVHPTCRESVPTPFRREGVSPPQAGPQAWKTRFPSSPAAAPLSSSAPAQGASPVRPPSTVLDMLGVSISTSLPPGSGSADGDESGGGGQLRRQKATGASTLSRSDLREAWKTGQEERNEGTGGMGSVETI
ncbi:hypothetical protein BJ742DRAFT_475444 [Cladochytrium replicatum]|nr:hypothetical protein BJ742DRAFT_475444 [Cladochytrium replicatum]